MMTVSDFTTRELLKAADDLRKIQHELNRDNSLAGSWSAWGDLDRAMKRILKRYFLILGVSNPGQLAMRIVDSVYENGEGLKYQVDLWITGEITISGYETLIDDL
jgi:hypothetical protein